MSTLIDLLRTGLDGTLAGLSAPTDPKPAAVLALIYPPDGDHKILLTKRTTLVGRHRGEVSFPGGHYETGVDRTLLETALRESAEEIGLIPSSVEMLGALEPRQTRFGQTVTPFVGVLHEPQEFVPQPTEVEVILEVPVASLLGPDALCYEPRVYSGTQVSTPYFCYNDHVIWGATARILRQLLAILDPAGHAVPFEPVRLSNPA